MKYVSEVVKGSDNVRSCTIRVFLILTFKFDFLVTLNKSSYDDLNCYNKQPLFVLQSSKDEKFRRYFAKKINVGLKNSSFFFICCARPTY